jgi:hypothetical protein
MQKQLYKLTLLLLIIPLFTSAQVNLNVIKYSRDSISIFLDPGVELTMNGTYDFVVKTNITPADNLVLSSIQDTLIHDGLTFSTTFSYHEYGFFVKRDNKIVGTQSVISLKGTKYEVKIDGKVISRYKPNVVNDRSVIEIELKSDTEDTDGLLVKTPVLMYWTQDKKIVKRFELIDLKIKVDLSKERGLKKGHHPKMEMNFLVIHLPQVYDESDREMLAKEEKERTFLLGFE